MPLRRFFPPHRLLRAAFALACAALLCTAAPAAGLRVLTADADAGGSAQGEFVRELRERQDIGRFSLVRLSAAGGAGRASGALDDGHAGAGRMDRAPAAETADVAESCVTIAVGPGAARAAIGEPGQDPLVLAMLGRLDYERLKTSAALRHPDRRIGVLLREPALADQLALIAAILPHKRRLGVIATTESEPLVSELQLAAQGFGFDLEIEYAADARSLAGVLRLLVSRSDALLVLPDMIGNDQAATLTILRAGAGAGLPVFGTSDGIVRSGGLAAAVSTPDQLAQQAIALGRKLEAAGPGGGVVVEAAAPAAVRINPTVAHALGLRLPDERTLIASIASTAGVK